MRYPRRRQATRLEGKHSTKVETIMLSEGLRHVFAPYLSFQVPWIHEHFCGLVDFLLGSRRLIEGRANLLRGFLQEAKWVRVQDAKVPTVNKKPT